MVLLQWLNETEIKPPEETLHSQNNFAAQGHYYNLMTGYEIQRKFNVCPYCSYTSSNVRNVKRHIRTHTGEMPYHCTSCPFKCSDQSSLKRHMKRH